MGLGTKLNFAFITVILVMVVTSAIYWFGSDYFSSKSLAEKHLGEAAFRLNNELNLIDGINQSAATDAIRDSEFTGAFAKRDRQAVAQALKAIADRRSYSGFFSAIDSQGNLFYSMETPSKFGYSLRENPVVKSIMYRMTPFHGPISLSITGGVTDSYILPIPGGGMLAANQPINNELLSGLTTKWTLSANRLIDIDLVLVSGKEPKVLATTPDLIGKDNGYLVRLNSEGIKAIQTEVADHLWRPFPLQPMSNYLVGVILIATPMPNLLSKLVGVLGQASVTAVVALIIAFMLSSGLSKHFTTSMRFLIQRVSNAGAQRPSMPPLEVLSGEWLELGEAIDNSMASLRSSMQSLQTQLSKQSFSTEGKLKDAETTSQQFETLNRQLSIQTKQLAEVSKQINYANQQAVLLQHKLSGVLQVSTEGYLLLDQFGNILSANPVFLSWLGATEGEIAGRSCFDLVRRPGDPPTDGKSAQAFAKHGGNPGDLVNQFYPEAVVWNRNKKKSTEILSHLHPIMGDDGAIQSWIMVLRDKSLHSELAQLRTEIVAMLSDSIRAPLASVEPTWTKLLNSTTQTMDPSVGQFLAQLHSHYDQVIGLVDSLLMMYGGAAPLPVVPTEQIVITRLVADCLEEVATHAREQQLMLDYKTVTGLPPMNGDRDTLKSVLRQLLEKMIGITAPGGRVRVENQIKTDGVRISVSSSGPALPQDEIDDMFVGFIQGKHAEESYSTRLSMYLTRNNIERMGGKIWAESEAGRGTVIFCMLPLK